MKSFGKQPPGSLPSTNSSYNSQISSSYNNYNSLHNNNNNNNNNNTNLQNNYNNYNNTIRSQYSSTPSSSSSSSGSVLQQRSFGGGSSSSGNYHHSTAPSAPSTTSSFSSSLLNSNTSTKTNGTSSSNYAMNSNTSSSNNSSNSSHTIGNGGGGGSGGGDEEEIIQGLLCPSCMKDLRSISQLQKHWEESHANEDKAVFSSLGSLGSWIKGKKNAVTSSLIGNSSGSNSSSSSSSSSSGTASGGGSGEDGNSTDYITKEHWEPDSASSICREPNCGKEFGLRERRHHCRKCGRLFCGEHCVYQMRLNGLAQHDVENGIMCKVCKSCFEGRQVAPQSFGTFRNLTKEFLAMRKTSNGEIELKTNQRLTRLDKLLTQLERARNSTTNKIMLTPAARKSAERGIVDWEDDSKVPACRSCSRSFGLRNRRHHCRLCGFVICGEPECSEMLSLRSAKRLTDNASGIKANRKMLATDAGDEELEVRVCQTCINLMFRRATQAARSKARPPPYAQLYEKLSATRKQIDELISKLKFKAEKIADQNNIYKETDWAEGLQLKAELSSLFDQYDKLSKEIANSALPEYRGEGVESSKDKEKRERKRAAQSRIQQNIRLAAAAFLTENIFVLDLISNKKKPTATITTTATASSSASSASSSISSSSPMDPPYRTTSPVQTHYESAGYSSEPEKSRTNKPTSNSRPTSMYSSTTSNLNTGNYSGNSSSSSGNSGNSGGKSSSTASTFSSSSRTQGGGNALSLDAQVALEQRDRVKQFIQEALAEGRIDEANSLKRELEQMNIFMKEFGLSN